MVEKLRAVLARPPAEVELAPGHRRAAVAAIAVGPPDADPEATRIVLVRRAEKKGDPWSGHIAFPGGRVEAGETVLEAAMRETWEEIGLELPSSTWIGVLDPISTRGPLPAMVIYPHVFWLPGLPALRPNEEIASVHSLSLAALLAGEGRGTMVHPWRDREVELPRVEFEGQRLWGLTLHIVDDLLHRLDGGGRGMERLGRRDSTPWEGDARGVFKG